MRPPSFNLKHVFSARKKICGHIDIAAMAEVELVGADFERFVDTLQAVMPGGKSIKRATLRDSLLPFIGARLTEDLTRTIAWRLAGNMKRLRSGIAVKPWRRQTFDEWVPVQIVGTQIHKTRYGKIGTKLEMRILAGTSATEFTSAFWTRQFSRYIGQDLGFSKPYGDTPFTNDAELTNFRLLIKVSAEKSKTHPVPEQFKPFASGVAWNKQLLLWRTRSHGCGHHCPKNYPESVKCYQCEVGYVSRKQPVPGGKPIDTVACKAATHRIEYDIKDCPKCNKRAYFDLDKSNSICVSCLTDSVIKSKIKGV